MYAANKKDINRHKAFHALSGANIAKRENLKAEKREREEKQEDRLSQLEKERREARLDSQFDSAEGNSSGFTSIQKRTAWMLETKAGQNGQDSEENQGSSSARVEDAKDAGSRGVTLTTTGVITKEEAELARKRLNDEKKRRLDPLARADSEIDNAVRARLLSTASYASTHVSAISATAGSGSSANQNQARMMSLLARARK